MFQHFWTHWLINICTFQSLFYPHLSGITSHFFCNNGQRNGKCACREQNDPNLPTHTVSGSLSPPSRTPLHPKTEISHPERSGITSPAIGTLLLCSDGAESRLFCSSSWRTAPCTHAKTSTFALKPHSTVTESRCGLILLYFTLEEFSLYLANMPPSGQKSDPIQISFLFILHIKRIRF